MKKRATTETMISKSLTRFVNHRRRSPGLPLALAFASLAFAQLSPRFAQGASFQSTGSMTSPRQFHTATLLPNGQVLVSGGWDETNNLASAELFDPASGSWSATNSMGLQRAWHTATLLPSGKVLVTGGLNYTNEVSTEEVYDPAQGLWSAIAPMASRRSGHTATLLPSGQVLVAGGSDGTNDLSTAELYDPFSATWTPAASMNMARASHTATPLPNGQVLVVGAYSGPGAFTAEIYDPVAGTWTMTADLRSPRWGHIATLLPSGLVLVAGGEVVFIDLELSINNAELYDPATGTWADTTPMVHGRFGHAATLLASGLVLVTGGLEAIPFVSPNTLSESELYDPAARTWTAAETMTASRLNHTATMLTNGQVLVAGGRDWLSHNLRASAELYDYPNVPVTQPTTLADPKMLTNGSFQFSFTNTPGGTFHVLVTTFPTLPSTEWMVRGGVTEILPGQFQFTDPHATNYAKRFYRTRAFQLP